MDSYQFEILFVILLKVHSPYSFFFEIKNKRKIHLIELEFKIEYFQIKWILFLCTWTSLNLLLKGLLICFLRCYLTLSEFIVSFEENKKYSLSWWKISSSKINLWILMTRDKLNFTFIYNSISELYLSQTLIQLMIQQTPPLKFWNKKGLKYFNFKWYYLHRASACFNNSIFIFDIFSNLQQVFISK